MNIKDCEIPPNTVTLVAYSEGPIFHYCLRFILDKPYFGQSPTVRCFLSRDFKILTRVRKRDFVASQKTVWGLDRSRCLMREDRYVMVCCRGAVTDMD